MTHFISFQPIPVLIDGHDNDGRLVFADGQLTAVLVRLDGEHHTTDQGKWHLEAGFGKCAVAPADALLWGSTNEAGAWVRERLANSPSKQSRVLHNAPVWNDFDGD